MKFHYYYYLVVYINIDKNYYYYDLLYVIIYNIINITQVLSSNYI
jgi:hypothetical protein